MGDTFCHALCTCGRAFSCQCSDALVNSGHRSALGGPHSLLNARCRTYSKSPTDGHLVVFSPLRYSRCTSKPCGTSGCCSHRCSALGGHGPAQDASRFERGFTSLRVPARSFKSRVRQVESHSFPGPAHSSTPGTRPPPCPQHLPGGAPGRAQSPALSLEPGPAVTPLKGRARSGLSAGRRSSGPCRCPKVQGAGLGRGKWGPGDVGEKRAPMTAPRLTAGPQPHSGFAAGCFRFSP